MPLDPYFTDRLRIHRRYLLRRAVQAVRGRIERWVRRPSPERTGRGSETSAVAATPTAGQARERHRRAARAWDRDELRDAGTAGPDVSTTEHTVPVAGFPDVRVRLYRPVDSEGSRRPAVITFFGGAFRIGGVDYPTTDAACRRRTVEADVVMVAVDYSLAPEHRFPTQVEQGHAALEWVFAQAEALGVDPGRIALHGTSAGGAIAAAVTLMNRDRGGRPLRMQVLEVPVTDLTGCHIDLRPTWRMGVPALIVLRELRSISRTYLRRPSDATHPYASPLRAADHAGLPPALILTAEYDTLRGDGAAYGAALRRAGVDATVVRYEGVTHDTPLYTGALPAARTWHAQVVTALRGLHD